MRNLINILLSVVLSEYQIESRSLCIRSNSDASPYEINPHGAKYGRLVGRVSSSVTGQFLLETVSSSEGHADIKCHQDDLDVAIREYERCVRQIQHQLRCSGSRDSVCGWFHTFVETCTGKILGRCLSDQSLESLKLLQNAVIRNNDKVAREGCDENDQIQGVLDFVRDLQHQENFLSSSPQKFPASTVLRLG